MIEGNASLQCCRGATIETLNNLQRSSMHIMDRVNVNRLCFIHLAPRVFCIIYRVTLFYSGQARTFRLQVYSIDLA